MGIVHNLHGNYGHKFNTTKWFNLKKNYQYNVPAQGIILMSCLLWYTNTLSVLIRVGVSRVSMVRICDSSKVLLLVWELYYGGIIFIAFNRCMHVFVYVILFHFSFISYVQAT